ncbi:hypothetical protein SDC9_124980 [bioreactor metagenome]|uniref:Uncharacterized protein n=1 Tax=bioreactor metagenome TaxID=1076179 RepID=A0A645CLP6_9ZZZZ
MPDDDAVDGALTEVLAPVDGPDLDGVTTVVQFARHVAGVFLHTPRIGVVTGGDERYTSCHRAEPPPMVSRSASGIRAMDPCHHRRDIRTTFLAAGPAASPRSPPCATPEHRHTGHRRTDGGPGVPGGDRLPSSRRTGGAGAGLDRGSYDRPFAPFTPPR